MIVTVSLISLLTSSMQSSSSSQWQLQTCISRMENSRRTQVNHQRERYHSQNCQHCDHFDLSGNAVQMNQYPQYCRSRKRDCPTNMAYPTSWDHERPILGTQRHPSQFCQPTQRFRSLTETHPFHSQVPSHYNYQSVTHEVQQPPASRPVTHEVQQPHTSRPVTREVQKLPASRPNALTDNNDTSNFPFSKDRGVPRFVRSPRLMSYLQTSYPRNSKQFSEATSIHDLEWEKGKKFSRMALNQYLNLKITLSVVPYRSDDNNGTFYC